MRPVLAFAAASLLLGASSFAEAPVIVIDPGHGGAQEGARGATGATEKEICLSVSKKLAAALRLAVKADVTLTRDTDADITLPARVERANQKAPRLFISIHANSMPTRRLREKVSGIETFFL